MRDGLVDLPSLGQAAGVYTRLKNLTFLNLLTYLYYHTTAVLSTPILIVTQQQALQQQVLVREQVLQQQVLVYQQLT